MTTPSKMKCPKCGIEKSVTHKAYLKRLEKYGNDVERMNREWTCKSCRKVK